MILIADSGSTKTDWRLIDDYKQIHQFSTQGINPYFQSIEEISQILILELKPQLISENLLIEKQVSNSINRRTTPKSEIFFYGAGCGADDKKDIVDTALKNTFSKFSVEINTDMLGSARALCGQQAGIVAILGTGANTCFYNGTKISNSTNSLGFILGDEGSGAHIGKNFIQAYLNHEIPEHLIDNFYERFKLSTADILDAVYRKPMPNRFLAGFSKFVFQNLKEQVFIDLVANCFREFFEKHICKYPQHKVLKLNCSGSVVFYFSNIFRSVADEYEVRIDKIVESPIAALTLYHTGEI